MRTGIVVLFFFTNLTRFGCLIQTFFLQSKTVNVIINLNFADSPMDLLQVSLTPKTGEGIKARETCNTWQPGSLAGQDSVQLASFYKKPISNHMIRKDNATTE